MAQVIQSVALSGRVAAKSDTKTTNPLLIPIFISGLIFFITALVGVWVAPNQNIAFDRFLLFTLGLIIVGGIAWSAKQNVEFALGFFGLLCGVLAAILTAHFLLTVNWSEVNFTRFFILEQIGLRIHNNSLQLSELPHLQKNITGGILIVALPLIFGAVVWAWRRRSILTAAISTVILTINFFGLIMSNSRGAWLGLGFGLLYGAYFFWRWGRGDESNLKWIGDFLVIAIILSFVYLFWLVVTYPEYRASFNQIVPESSPTRIDLWHYSLPLVQDYWFTGSGLGNTAMVLSSYVFILHVPFFYHAHNIFLQIAIEQGVPGLVAFVTLVGFTIWGLGYVYRAGDYYTKLFSAMTVVSLAGMVMHGMVEANLYAYQAMPVMFLPFGFAIGLIVFATEKSHQTEALTEFDQVWRQRIAIWGGLTPCIVIVLMFLWPGSLATLQANLGAVAQTRAELAVYSWPEWPIQDELRRNNEVDLSQAIRHYNAALLLDPDNVTALRRLGQIEVSTGEYQAAKQHLEAAYQADPNQRATRQMLGELYAISSNVSEAVRLWQPLDLEQGQLDARRWWYYHIDAPQQAELLEEATTALQKIHQ